jgi:hypothetical protein
MKKTIVLLPGDGIGPEVTRAAAAILRESAQEFNHQFEFAERHFPTRRWTLAGKRTLFFWEPSAGRSGMRCRLGSARRAGCSICAKGWGFTSTFVP